MRFQLGDRVVAIRPVANRSDLRGKYGTVVTVNTSDPPLGVEFDEPFDGGHSCRGRGRRGRCRYGSYEEFALVPPFEEEEEMIICDEDSKYLDAFLSGFKCVN